MVYTISRQSRDAERMRQMTETKRLYYEDVYKKEFTAKVLECREAKKGFHIILDESALPGGRWTAKRYRISQRCESKGSA